LSEYKIIKRIDTPNTQKHNFPLSWIATEPRVLIGYVEVVTSNILPATS